MLNTTPLNTSELNAPGFSSESVALEGTGAVAVVGTPPTLVFLVGLAGSGAVVATQSAAATRGRTAAVAASVTVASAAAITQERALSATGAVSAGGILGLSIPRELAASSAVNVTAAIYSGSELFASTSVSVTASVAASNVEALFGTGAVAAVGTETGYIDRRMYATPTVAVTSVAVPDFEVGGVLVVGLAGLPAVNVTQSTALDPTENVAASGVAAVTSSAALTIRFKLPASGTVALTENNPGLDVYTGGFGGAIPVVVTGVGSASRLANMAANSPVAVSAAPRLAATRRLDASAPVSVTAAVAAVKRPGLVATSPVSVTSSFPSVRIAEKIYGAGQVDVVGAASPIYYVRKNLGALALVDVVGAAAPVYFTRRNMQVEATITVEGELQPRSFASLAAVGAVAAVGAALLRTNMLSLEPDYRTVVVDPQEFTLTVEPQEFLLIVTTDSVPMQTFTKQPTEILSYDIDFEEWIAGIVGGDEVESATCTVVTASSGLTTDITIDSVQLVADTSRVKVWVSGGTNGVTYKLTLVMVTAAGRRKEVDFRIKIKET